MSIYYSTFIYMFVYSTNLTRTSPPHHQFALESQIQKETHHKVFFLKLCGSIIEFSFLHFHFVFCTHSAHVFVSSSR